jgi:hypothetical protein
MSGQYGTAMGIEKRPGKKHRHKWGAWIAPTSSFNREYTRRCKCNRVQRMPEAKFLARKS